MELNAIKKVLDSPQPVSGILERHPTDDPMHLIPLAKEQLGQV
jgi:hypothetical protein